ncbi:MAG: NADP-dependent phosphogluconate dehydrogenase [Candidatus Magasanikbacteria bacterium]|nr:NADP-dependent phosphogluconate dehydrogenase [Candidatus Magasanikbacteria bacterium]
MTQSNLGLIGLAVMGSNLARNFASRGFRISVYNRTNSKTNEFIKNFSSSAKKQGGALVGASEYTEFIQSLERPRKIIIMVKAGSPVDGVIAELLPHLEPGDIVIDAGNSFYKDTERRFLELKAKGLHFVGMGVSGGEEGALNGSSIMLGGAPESWRELQPALEAIAAKDFSGEPCVTYVGPGGAGHYVKMVHNGIEYAVMQMMSEAYAFLKIAYNLKPPAIADIFEKFSQGKLNSFLFDIAVPVLRRPDDLTKKGFLIDKILDRAGSKGTGAWASKDALDRGISITSITEAVYARSISASKESRVALSKLYKNKLAPKKLPLPKFIPLLENALYAGMISCYAQGYDLIQKTATEEKWDLNLAEISRVWEGGCIIRAKLLNVLHKAYQTSGSKNSSLFAVPGIVSLMKKYVPDLRAVVGVVSASGVSTPALATALFYFQDATSKELSANFIQGLRDYFGAHTYERTDRPGNFHTNWIS